MKIEKISASIFSMLVGLAFASSGQGENLENMETKLGKTVVTATMTPKELKEVPGAFEVITADEIRGMGAETVADALEDAVSLDLDHVAGRGFIPQIRGLGNKRTLVLIDGMRFSSGFRDTTVDLSEVPTEIIERIEIIRGPTSALYGSEGIGGVINIITKKAPKKFSGSGGVRYGMNTYGDAENYIVKTTLGDTLGKIGVIAAGQLNNTDKFDRHKDDSFTEIDDVEKYSGMLKLCYDFADSQALSAGVFHTDVDREGIRNKYGLEWDRDADSKRTSTFLQYDGSIAGASVMTRGYYSDFESDRSYVDIGDPYNIPSLQNKAKKQPDREDFDIKNKLYQIESRASRIFAKSHLLTMGMEYRKEKRSGIENRGETEINKTVHNRAVFLQDDFPLFDCLLFTAGVRLDDHSDFGSEVSPRASLIYSILENFRFKTSYGEGFRAPSVYELYVYTDNSKGDVIPNPDLVSETSKSYEIGFEGEYKNLNGKIMAFRNDINDMIYKKPTGISRMQGKKKVLEYQKINLDEAYTQGIEIEAGLILPWNLSIFANSTFMDSNNDDTDDDLLEVPEMKLNGRICYAIPDVGFKANIRANYTGEQVIAPKFEDGAQDKAGGYTVWDVFVEKDINRNFTLFAGIDNMFNREMPYASDRGAFFYCGFSTKF